jgi:hypothetical protein
LSQRRRQIVHDLLAQKLTDTLALGSRKVSIPFDATGKKWVRFTVWDAADNGAWTQPIVLK